METKNVARGALIITFGLFATRLIGMIYQIPLNNFLGGLGQQVFLVSFIPFVFLNQLTTSGIPPAISRILSANDALNRQIENIKVIKHAKLLLGVISVTAFIILNILAEPLSYYTYTYQSKSDFTFEQYESGRQAIVLATRIISLAILVVPHLSLYRGMLQSKSDLKPISISYIIEQLFKVIIGLGFGFIVFYPYRNLPRIAIANLNEIAYTNSIYHLVYVQHLASIIATIGTLYYVSEKVRKYKKRAKFKIKYEKRIFKLIVLTALPIILVSLDFTVFNLIDVLVGESSLTNYYATKEEATIANTAFMQEAMKVARIPSAIVIGIELALIPVISALYAKREYKEANKIINNSFIMLIKILLPATIFMFFASTAIYTSIYASNANSFKIMQGTNSIKTLSLLMLTDIIYFPLTVVVISLKQEKYIYKAFAAGLLFKILFTNVLINYFGIIGLGMSYIVSYIIMSIILIDETSKEKKFRLNFYLKATFLKTVVASGCFLGLTLITIPLFNTGLFLNSSRILQILIIGLCGLINFWIYLLILQKLDRRAKILDHFKTN